MLQVLGGHLDFPGSVAFGQSAQSIALIYLPVVEIADDIDGGSVGCPLAKDPFLVLEMEAEVEIAGGKVRELLFATVGELGKFVDDVLVTSLDSSSIRLQPLVLTDEAQLFWSSDSILVSALLGRSFRRLLGGSFCRSFPLRYRGLGLFFFSHYIDLFKF